MRDLLRPNDLDFTSTDRPARILAFLFLALAPAPLLGHLLIPTPRQPVSAQQIAELTALYAGTGLVFSRMRWHSTDVRLVVAVPGVCLLALLGTMAVMGVGPNPNEGATYLVGSILIPISVGLTQRRGHATVAAALTVLGVLATAKAVNHLQLDQIVAFTAFVASAIAGEAVAQGRHRNRLALDGLSRLTVSNQRLTTTETRDEAYTVAVTAACELSRADAAAITGARGAGAEVLAVSPALEAWSPAHRQDLEAGTSDPTWQCALGEQRVLRVFGARSHDGRLRLDLLSQAVTEHLMRLDLVDRLQREALNDALTGIGNRRAAMRELALVNPGDAVMLIDLDHFKQVNDLHGHDAGDLELRSLGRFLAETVRREDRVFRFGGEEFLILLEADDAVAISHRLQQDWAERRQLTTLSAGCAPHRGGDDPSVTLKRADEALYRAKHAGRNRVEFAA